jgi:hypothetical protein
MEKINFSVNFVKKNVRYFLAALAIIAMFFISRSFPAQVITSESCAGGNCQAILDSPNLTRENPSYYVNDAMKSGPGQYYRLTFLTRTNKDTKIAVKITNPSDEDRELKTLELKKSEKNNFQEILFSTDNKYSDILFKKTDASDGADTNISSVQISKLEINSERDFANLKPAIRGEINVDSADQSQRDNSYVFNQLKDPNTILGQIFKPQADYIASVTLDMDIVKQDNNGGKKYKFELREAEFDGRVPEITSRVLSSVDFTVENAERYRQADGKFNFPILAKLDPEKYYFIGINNGNVAVDKFNYLRLRGTQDSKKYADGTVAVKTKGKTYSAVGNLYFITHQLSFSRYQDKKILSGEIIEDIGKPKGLFTYKSMGNIYDLADLEEYSPDIEYDDDKKTLAGTIEAGADSYMIYKFDTIFPASKIRITGKQASADWDKVSISYSPDSISWKEIPDNITNDSNNPDNNLQYFDYSWNINPAIDEIYVKIVSRESQDGKRYGVKDFKVEADISMR